MKTVLVTGAAGFIGFTTCQRLLRDGGWRVLGLDNLNDYYDVTLKHARIAQLNALPQAENFSFYHLNLADRSAVLRLFAEHQPTVIIHLGAQAGVRYGKKNPLAYLESNLVGHFSILEACRQNDMQGCPVEHLLYASSSSVYGNNGNDSFTEADDITHPRSLYAATKAADELITESWSNQFGTPATGLRFFTVYGPWGRPDMSPMIFASHILNGTPIPLFNGGDLWRDFTDVDDIVEAILRLVPHVPQRTGASPAHVVYNLGNQQPVLMSDFVKVMEQALGQPALIDNLPWPETEVYKTSADTTKLKNAVGWAPSTPLAEGLQRFADWYLPRHGQITV